VRKLIKKNPDIKKVKKRIFFIEIIIS